MRKVNLRLCDEDISLYDSVKRRIGIKTDTETMRFLITFYARSEGLIADV